MDTTAQSIDVFRNAMNAAVRGEFVAFTRLYFFEYEAEFPSSFINLARNLVFDSFKSKQYAFMSCDIVTQAFIPVALLETAFTVLCDTPFFVTDSLTNKLVLQKSLDEESLFTLVTKVCQGKYEERGINRQIQGFFPPMLLSIFEELTKNGRFFERKEEKEELARRLVYDMRYMTSHERWQLRSRILDELRSTPKPTIISVAKKLRVNRDTVSEIARRLREKPNLTYDDLDEQKRGPKADPYGAIPKEVFFKLLTVLSEQTPHDFGLEYSTWCMAAILEYLEKQHEIILKPSALYAILRKNEVTSKFASRTNFKQDQAKKEEFIRTGFLEICRRAEREGRKLVVGDQVGVLCGYRRKGYAKKGSRTHSAYNSGLQHTKESRLIFLSPSGEMWVYTIAGAFTAKKFVEKLRQLYHDNPGVKFLLVLDNCSIHKAKVVREFLESLPDEAIVIEYFPAYCPEINPVEYINNAFKSYLSKTAADKTLVDVSLKADEYFWEIYDSPEKAEIIQGFFLAEEASYSMVQYLQAKKEFQSMKAA